MSFSRHDVTWTIIMGWCMNVRMMCVCLCVCVCVIELFKVLDEMMANVRFVPMYVVRVYECVCM